MTDDRSAMMKPSDYLDRAANILIVDDAEENLKLLADTLMREGYQVRPARSGRMAIESAKRWTPDLVLLDIRMPEMDGFAVCRQLKSHPPTADTPVIFISAVEELGDKIKAFDTGGVDYITKPFREKEILSRVKTHLTLHTMHQNLEALVERRTEELKKTNRALRLISHSNQLLVHMKSESALLEAFCDSLAAMGGYPFCWVGYASAKTDGRCDPIQWAPAADPLLSEVAQTESRWPEGPAARALASRQLVRCNDLAHPAAGGEWPETALKKGLRACVGIPLAGETAVFGTLTVYAAQNGFFDAAEADLLRELADNLALGIHMMRERGLREQAETALVESEKRLLQAQKMEALGTLASGIAHDFNNILYPIIGYAELALGHTDRDTPNHRRLNEILGCAKRANDLVGQILAFSRKSKPELRTLLLPPIIEEAVEPFRAFLPRAISMRLEIDAACGFVRADPTHVHQIVINLITNATHAMEETGGSLTVSLYEERLGASQMLHEEMHPGDYARLTVADTGAGIEPAVMEKLFDPYFTTKEKGKGTGLGLAVVHGIVTGYGGGVRVVSKVGEGARFDVYLPVTRQNGEAAEKPVEAGLPRGRERILVVDDEPQSRNLMHESLTLLGYRVCRCNGGSDALQTFRAAPDRFDLVLTDFAMPDMSGEELARALSAIRPSIPIILCSGLSEPFGDADATAVSGIRKYLRKPLSQGELARAVRAILDGG